MTLLSLVVMAAMLIVFVYAFVSIASEITLCLVEEEFTPGNDAYAIGAMGLIAVLAYLAIGNILLS